MTGIGGQSAFFFRIRNALKAEKKTDLILVLVFLFGMLLFFTSGLQRMALTLSAIANVKIGLFWSLFSVAFSSILVLLAEYSGKRSWLVASLHLTKRAQVQQQVVGFCLTLALGLVVVLIGFGLSSGVSLSDLGVTVVATVYFTFLGGILRFLTTLKQQSNNFNVSRSEFKIHADYMSMIFKYFEDFYSKAGIRTTLFFTLRRPSVAFPTILIVIISLLTTALACIATDSLQFLPAGSSIALLVFQLDRYEIGSLYGRISKSFGIGLWAKIVRNWKALASPHFALAIAVVVLLLAENTANNSYDMALAIGSIISTLFAPLALWFWLVESAAGGFVASAVRATLISIVVFVLLIMLSPIGALVLWLCIKRARFKLDSLDMKEPYRWINPV